MDTFSDVLGWLTELGLWIDIDKTELMFFHSKSWSKKLSRTPLMSITLPHNLRHITPTKALWYLHIFFTPTLNWNLHTTTLASRAWSITKALGIIRNSIWGLSLMPWQKKFIAIIIPILTYGSQVWFTDIRQKSLIEQLQIAQNEGCWRLAGVFKMTLIHETQKLISIPPIHLHLHHLLHSAGLQLSKLPQNCHIRNLCPTCWVTLPPPYFTDISTLPLIAETPTTPTPFFPPHHPSKPKWSHEQFILHLKIKPHSTSKTTLKWHDYSYKILIATDICHIPGIILGMFSIFTHTGLILSDFVHSLSPCSATLLTLTAALWHLTSKKFVHFFFTDSSFFSYYNGDHKPNLTTSITPFLHMVDDYLTSSPSCIISGYWYDRT